MVGTGFYHVLGGDMNWWQLSTITLVAVWKKAVGIGAGEAVGSKVRRQLLGSLGFLSMSHPFLLLLDPTIKLYLLQKKKKKGSQTILLDSLRRWRPWKDGDSIWWELCVGGRTDLFSYGCRPTLGKCVRKHPTLGVRETDCGEGRQGGHWEVSYFVCGGGWGAVSTCAHVQIIWEWAESPLERSSRDRGRKRWRCTKH